MHKKLFKSLLALAMIIPAIAVPVKANDGNPNLALNATVTVCIIFN